MGSPTSSPARAASTASHSCGNAETSIPERNNATRHANQGLCTLARELPNFTLAGYWWQNFYPDAIAQIIGERLDMVPLPSQCGFFSDAYTIEWTYAKAMIVRKSFAKALAERVQRGQYSVEDALSIASSVLRDTPERLLRMAPRPGTE
ncbi:hypothetical protein GCM10023322_70600 [Rugosimonospora acidiphila]|uniref:Uncharacterized protein n=1 Tax=Rugosimonospora acidiphila TaxID=556531 RepID=A0ABP9SN55_9ACTN